MEVVSKLLLSCFQSRSILYLLNHDDLFIHGTITVLESPASCLLAVDLFWVLSQSRQQLFIHFIPRRYVIPSQLLWNGAQPPFYFRHLRCVGALQLYTSDIYVLLQNHGLYPPRHSPRKYLLPIIQILNEITLDECVVVAI